MAVKIKINEARFFLQKINENYKKSPDNRYYLNAFLSSTYSIKDHLLADYNRYYKLGVPHDMQFKKNFELKALEEANVGNITPFAFVLWYNKKTKSLIKETTYGKVLEESRHKTTHDESIRVENLIELMFGVNVPEQYIEQVKLANPHLDITVFDTGDVMKNMHLEDCNEIFMMMENFVIESLQKFPNPLTDVEFQGINPEIE